MLKCVIGVVENGRKGLWGGPSKRSEVRSSAEWVQVSKLKKWGVGQGGGPTHTHLGAGVVSESNTDRLGEVADSQLYTALQTIFRVHWPMEWKVLMSRWIRLKIGLELNQGLRLKAGFLSMFH